MKRSMIVLSTLIMGGGAVLAQQSLVDEGQTLMKLNARNFGGVMGAMAKGEKPFDQAAVDAALAQLEDTARKLPTLYPESTKGLKAQGDYSPGPKIYEDRAGFDARIASFAAAVMAAKAGIKDLDSLKASVPAISRECGGCHETFRVKNS